jgi:1,4-dihydroxy-6-naphthoate synthase
MKDITIAYSPCPNDCFIFDALIHKRIDTRGYNFIPVLADVETLNQAAFRGEYDVTKLSYHAYAYCCDKYVMLDSGSALGNNCGPLLISKRDISQEEVRSGKLKIAIPGKFTTANFLFSIAFPEAKNKTEMVFSAIENAVLSGEVDAGLIIHENRFTYTQKGLKKIIDLGEFWETKTGQAIPLGGIAAKRDRADAGVISDLIAESVKFAFENPAASLPYVKDHAAEMDEAVMQQHINLYVNEYSVSLGSNGRAAVERLFSLGRESGIIPSSDNSLIIPAEVQSE